MSWKKLILAIILSIYLITVSVALLGMILNFAGVINSNFWDIFAYKLILATAVFFTYGFLIFLLKILWEWVFEK